MDPGVENSVMWRYLSGEGGCKPAPPRGLAEPPTVIG